MGQVLVLYHYCFPDNVVSAIHFSDLCSGLAVRGWKVTAMPCNRGCRDESQRYLGTDEWQGVAIRRIWRPAFRQASGLGRLVNAVWMTTAWSLLALDPRLRPDVLVVGTDPIFSPLVTFSWSMVRRTLKIAHWCFDLYPDAAVADGVVREDQFAVRLLRGLLRRAYRHFHLVVDIGECMRRRLTKFAHVGREATIVPWALVENDLPSGTPVVQRQSLVGDASLALLYSGNFGRAHTWRGIPELATRLRAAGGQVVFSVRGNAVPQLQEAVRHADAPIRFVEFASAEQLEERLSAADVHIVSLKEEWTGTVVPSKFFGALAIGRPVLFAGSHESAVARWIEQFGVGWILDPERIPELVDELVSWSKCPESKARMFQHCHDVYMREFSRNKALDEWDRQLADLIVTTK